MMARQSSPAPYVAAAGSPGWWLELEPSGWRRNSSWPPIGRNICGPGVGQKQLASERLRPMSGNGN